MTVDRQHKPSQTDVGICSSISTGSLCNPKLLYKIYKWPLLSHHSPTNQPTIINNKPNKQRGIAIPPAAVYLLPPSPSLKYLPDQPVRMVPPTYEVHRQSLKRPRDVYEVAIVSPSSSPRANPPIEIIDLTSEDTRPPPLFPAFKRQKLAFPAPRPPIPPSTTSSARDRFWGRDRDPPLLENSEEEKVDIDLTGIATTISSGSDSTWSRSPSSSSGSACSSMSTTTAFLPLPQVLLPPKGPKPLGTNWEALGPIDEFPEDPLAVSYEPPSPCTFPDGPSSDIISANPEVAFLFHIKSVGAERFFAKPVTSADSMYFLPSTLTTSFFISLKMDMAGLSRLQRDMTLARKIGFLPYRTHAIAVNAIKNYSRLKRRCDNPEQMDGVGDKRKRDKGVEKDEDKDGNPLHLEPDWYPGETHFKQMAEEWLDSHPNIRGVKGIPGFANPDKWNTRKCKALRKINWEKWEADILKLR